MACAVQRRRFPVGASPTRQPLQPEAIGAVMEVTKWLKPSISVSRIGDSASVQAATRVNAEQASKRTMCRSAVNGEGALLPKLLIFFRYGQPDAEKRSRACLAPNLGFIRMATSVRLCNHAGAAWRRKAAIKCRTKICATVHPDCRLPTRSNIADVTVTCIEGEQRGDAYAKLVTDGGALRR